MSSISVSVPNVLLQNAANDLVVIHQIVAVGIPADSIRNGVVHLTSPGTLTKTVQKTATVFTFTPPAPVPDAKDVQIAALQGKVTAAAALIGNLQSRATSAENLNNALQHQVAASTAQITDLKGKIASAEASLAAVTAKAAPETPAPTAEEPAK
ncbi:MAG: hypothetical protein ACLGXA_24460 [Acidobacteriota bacterium]